VSLWLTYLPAQRAVASHYLLAVGVTLGALWVGSRLAYGGALTQAVFESD